jgi:signal transduction histidine kinase
MRWLKYLLCLFFLLPYAFNLKAQANPALPLKKVSVNTINYEQGLLNNETTDIITDTLGFTWVSTSSGLQRYNGYILENIDPMVNGEVVKIRTRVCFYRLKNGNLWIGYKKGVLEYNPFTNVFKNIILYNNPSDDFFTIVPLNETCEGIWCLKKGSGMVVYGKNGKIKKTIPSISTSILDGIIRSDDIHNSCLIATNSEHIFIRCSINSLLDYNITGNSFSQFSPGVEILSIGCNTRFLYISTHQNILKLYISDKKFISHYPLQNITGQPVSTCCLYALGNKRLIASVNDQIIEFDDDLNAPRLLTTFNDASVLSTRSVGRIYADAYGRIWLLTNDDIKRIQDKEIPFSYLRYPSPANNFVRSLYFDEQTHQLFAGCLNAGLQVYDSSSNPLWNQTLQTNDVKDILAIDKLSQNSYLVVTWSNGWYLLDLQKKQLSKFNFSADEKWKKTLYLNTFTNNMQRINNSTLLITCTANIFRCVFNGNNLISAKPILPFFKSTDDRITTCYMASDSSLWAGQVQGQLYRMGRNGKVEMINLPEKFTIRCITEDMEHHIWIGTNSGLYVCTLNGRVLKGFYKRSGLLNDCIYSLLPVTGKPSVIASSNMGLSVISLNGNIMNYTKELGLQDNEFNTSAALISSNGRYYFGGINGISAFYPAALNNFQNKPILNMTRLIVNDSSYSSSGICKGDTIRLNYNQNHMQFDFAAMGMLNADKYFYRYRLTGFENYWQSTHKPTDIRYILQPGNYTLQVACSNELSGKEVTKNILIVIDPPWWLTWWFFMLIGLCAIGMVVLIVSTYNKRRYQKALQELMVNQRLQNQRESISRDLHDNLGAQANAIFYGTELLKHENASPNNNLVDNLHDTASDMLTVLRETLWAMKITKVEAADVWLRVLNFTRKMGNYYSEIKMNINGIPPEDLAINPSTALNMILIVQEAINNAIRHSEASVIAINSYSCNDSWRIEITDDGKGFDLSEISKKRESYGLENMAQRANESNIAFVINSVPSHGTKVCIEVKLLNIGTQLI